MNRTIFSISLIFFFGTLVHAQYLDFNISLDTTWQYNQGGNISNLDVFDDYLVFNTDRYIHIYSIANIANPVLIHLIFVPNHIDDIAITDQKLIVSAGHSGILVYDISIPFNSVFLKNKLYNYSSGRYQPPGRIYGFDDYLIALTRGYSIGESGALVYKGSFTPDSETRYHTRKQYTHTEDYFIASDHRGFSIFDKNLESDTPLGSFLFDDDLGHFNTSISVIDTLLYYTYEHFADYLERLLIFSIKDPSNPDLLTEQVIAVPPFTTYSYTNDGNYLYLGRTHAYELHSKIFAYDFSNPNDVIISDTLSFDKAIQDLVLVNSTLFVAEGRSVHIYNKSDEGFEYIHSIDVSNSKGVIKTLANKHVMVSMISNTGVSILDKQTLYRMNTISQPGIKNIFLQNKNLLVSDGTKLFVYDISNPNDIKQLHVIENINASSIQPFKNNLIFCNRYSGSILSLLDINSFELTPLEGFDPCGSFAVFNNLVFMVKTTTYYGFTSTDLNVYQVSDEFEVVNTYSESFGDDFNSSKVLFKYPYLYTYGGTIH